MLKVDIRKAFDTIEPQTMLAAMISRGLSRGLALAVLDLHFGREPCFMLGEATSLPTPLQKGVAQGDPTSAWLFQACLEMLLSPVLGHLQSRQPLPTGLCMHALYMDDLLILGQTAQEMQEIYASVTTALGKGGLEVAPAKTQWICSGNFDAQELHLGESHVPCQPSLCFVGSRFHSDATKMMSTHRASHAWSVFLAWKPLLCAKGQPWFLRAKLLRSTATSSGLWQTVTGPLNLQTVRDINNTEIRMAIKMLAVRKQSAETWSTFFARRWRYARKMLSCLPSLASRFMSMHHQGVGHLFRHSSDASSILYIGSTLQHMLDPTVHGHLVVGRPRRWERSYLEYYGAAFPYPCESREEWKKGEEAFIHHYLRCWRLQRP